MNRFLGKAMILLVAFGAAISILASCNKEEPFDLLISLRPTLTVKSGMMIKSTFMKGKGPKLSDTVVLESVNVSGPTFEYPIAEVGETWFTFQLGNAFVEGTYNFCIRRGKALKTIGEVTYNFETVDDGFKPDASSTVYGKVFCGAKGLADVVVSDGYEVVKTDANGYYQMNSKKKNSYVFISVPSGYEVSAVGILPQFTKKLKLMPTVQERADFEVFEAGDQTNHTMLVFGDMHMANRTNDKAQFRTFTSDVNSYVTAHSQDKVYAITLGDMTWDLYWYSKSYCFEQYLADANAIKNLQVFHTIGNHDHDMNATGDWDTVVKYKQQVCPNYYSFNVGKVHYISVDNIQCTNATPSTTDGSVRQYNDFVVTEVIDWLKKDLSFVAKSTPVVVYMHAPVYSQSGSNSLNNASAFTALFSGYSQVLFETGHSHKIWNVTKNNITENNSGAVCGAWWWAGKYYPELNVAQDGAPCGYRVLEVKGNQISSYFKGTSRPETLQFRSYDRNQIKITPESCGVTNATNAQSFTDYLKKYGGYGDASSSNQVIINVWDYGTGWSIKVDEKETGKSLVATQTTLYDPLFFICYTGPRFAESSSVSWEPHLSNHMFRVTASSPTSTLEITVTDDEGRVYKETMTRPKAFTIATYK